MATTTRTRKRPQSARLDILALVSTGGGRVRNTHDDGPASPTDSLSPRRQEFDYDERKQLPPSRPSNDDHGGTEGPDADDWFLNETACPPAGQSQVGLTDGGSGKAGTPAAQEYDHHYDQDLDLAFHVLSPITETSSPVTATALPSAREPRCHHSRSHRPATLRIGDTHGASTLPTCELKQAIRATTLTEATASTSDPSSPKQGRRCHRRSAAVQLAKDSDRGAKMGNQHSHHLHAENGALDDSDTRSTQSVIRASRMKAGRVPRRSSMNVFKRLESKSPLPADITGTVIEVPRAATAPNLDGMADDEDDDLNEHDQDRSAARHAHRHSAPSPSIPVHPASPTATITEESAARPLSASDTITDHRPSSQSEESDEEESPAHLRVSALSPTLPAPSPIPEDSPHKYGLKDRMDTPEAASPPPDIEVNKAIRRSSGLAIFNVGLVKPSGTSMFASNNPHHRKPKPCSLPRLS